MDSPNKAAPASFAQNSADVHASAIVIVVIDTTYVGMASGVSSAALADNDSGSYPSRDSSDEDIEKMWPANRRITSAIASHLEVADVAAGDGGELVTRYV